MARDLPVVVCGIQFPDQGSKLGPLCWEHRVLAIGSPGKFMFPRLLNSPGLNPEPWQ